MLTLTFFAILALATTALAHNGVKNAAVMARMNGMTAIAANLKTIGQMVKGKTQFNATTAKSAANAIAAHAADSSDLFRARETDPKSEAKDLIWQNYADFESKARDLETAALNAARSIEAKSDLAPALTAIATTCKACHKLYRE